MSAVKGILVPSDFSETSDAALTYAVTMAQAFGARLYLLHVPGKTGENLETNFPVGRFETTAREKLDAVLTPEEIERLRPEYVMRIGVPAEEIVRYADARDVDLIVMGTHGRSGVAHLLMGSVAEHVVRAAPCPVLLVRHPKIIARKTPVASPGGRAKPVGAVIA
jgi:nucleotide-binding universal stress UspA family protein